MIPSIHVFAAPADKFFVNSFIVESDDALALVDTQFLVSTATAVGDEIVRIGKPLAGIIVTHPHPDHFNGLPVLLERFGPVPVFANQPTIDTIAATQAAKRVAWTPVYGDDYPKSDAIPDRMVESDTKFEIGSITFRSFDLGPGESADMTVLHVPEADSLIVSDLIYNQCHPWLAEQRTGIWLNLLNQVEAMFPAVPQIFPGHGPTGGRELFAEQRAYILEQREAVARFAQNGALDQTGLTAVRAIARRGREGWPLENLIDINAWALAAELAEIK